MLYKVDLLRARKTIKEHINNLKRYVKALGSFIDAKKISGVSVLHKKQV